MDKSWKSFFVFLYWMIPVVSVLGAWNWIEVGACRAKNIGTWAECIYYAWWGASFIFGG